MTARAEFYNYKSLLFDNKTKLARYVVEYRAAQPKRLVVCGFDWLSIQLWNRALAGKTWF